jgi:hypothetical protein
VFPLSQSVCSSPYVAERALALLFLFPVGMVILWFSSLRPLK